MKKTILVVILFVMVLVLSSCSGGEINSAKGWSLKYAEENYKLNQKNGKYIGYTITEYAIYHEFFEVYLEQYDDDYEYKLFRIVFISDSMNDVIYNVFILYDSPLFKFFKESSIKELYVKQQK